MTTPFRYPPLKFGSRFGSRLQPSLFYGAERLRTALAESAYYRLLFYSAMSTAPASQKMTTEHTVFGARYATHKGAQLHKFPFSRFIKELTSPTSYELTQALGSRLRGLGVDLFLYTSARDTQKGINIALFRPTPFIDRKPVFQSRWLCETTSQGVTFYNKAQGSHYYAMEEFTINGKLPSPAV